MGESASAISAENTSDCVPRGGLGIILFNVTLDRDVSLLGENIAAVGGSTGVLTVGAVARNLLSLGGRDGNSGFPAKTGSSVSHIGDSSW